MGLLRKVHMKIHFKCKTKSDTFKVQVFFTLKWLICLFCYFGYLLIWFECPSQGGEVHLDWGHLLDLITAFSCLPVSNEAVHHTGKSKGFEYGQTRIQILSLTFPSCVVFGKLLNLSGPQFLYLKNRNNNTYLAGLSWGLGQLHIKHIT